MNNTVYNAILLLGPTGTGKTPLGQQMETRALWHRNHHHFDFGENLRTAAEGKLELPEDKQLSGKETAIIKSVLASNTLLADEDFPIAEKLLTAFIEKRKLDPAFDVVILNGLPRHKSQAIALEKIVDIRVVITLSSTAETIHERISTNSGGDREGRVDDSVEEIEKKIKIYTEKTLPLVEHYKSLDRNILEIAVDLDTIPLYIIQGLETMPSLI